jgi:ParB family chromosome partitioning protein
MTGRELALASFWTERPLVLLFIERTGRSAFSLKDLIGFAESLPHQLIETFITRNPNQPRETFPTEHIERLAASIKARGLIQPITLRPITRGRHRFEIVAGECRYRAHQLLGAKDIRAEIVTVDDAEMQLRAIVENLQRQDMNPIEEANAFQSLLDQGYSVGRIVDELGLKSTAIVTQRLTLLNLTDDIQKLVASGNLAVTMAWGVAQVSSERQAQLVRDIGSGKLRTAEQVKHAGIALREAERNLTPSLSRRAPRRVTSRRSPVSRPRSSPSSRWSRPGFRTANASRRSVCPQIV